MELTPSQRLEGSRGSVYVVGNCRCETPWYRLYEGRKVFRNYRYDEREFYEAGQDEWIDVLIRVCTHPPGCHVADAKQRRDLLFFEARQVLAPAGGYFLEPIDWLEVAPETEEAPHLREFRGPREPLLVMSHPQGQALGSWRRDQKNCAPHCLRVTVQILDMVERLHTRGLLLGAMSPDDFLIDSAGRLFFLATDRIVQAGGVVRLRDLFPPERFPAGFGSPEVYRPSSSFDYRSDMFAWAAMCYFLVTGQDFTGSHADVDRSASVFDAERKQQFAAAMAEAAHQDLTWLQATTPGLHVRSARRITAAWVDCIGSCLSEDPTLRPDSAEQFRKTLRSAYGSSGLLGRILNR